MLYWCYHSSEWHRVSDHAIAAGEVNFVWRTTEKLFPTELKSVWRNRHLLNDSKLNPKWMNKKKCWEWNQNREREKTHNAFHYLTDLAWPRLNFDHHHFWFCLKKILMDISASFNFSILTMFFYWINEVFPFDYGNSFFWQRREKKKLVLIAWHWLRVKNINRICQLSKASKGSKVVVVYERQKPQQEGEVFSLM